MHRVTIEDIITMTDGLEYAENNYLLVSLDDPAAYYLTLSVQHEPGKVFRYSTLNSQILACLIGKVTGESEQAFIDRKIFKKLGIERYSWETARNGNAYGGFGLRLRALDMAKIGIMMLNQGRYQGEQVIPEKWMDEMTTIRNDGGKPHNEKYGYHCWITEVDGYKAYFAGGYGGQFIYNIPDLKIVVVITSRTDRHREFHRSIIEKYVVNALGNE